MYNGVYHENVLLPGEELTLELNANNTSAELKNIQFFVGMYDSSNNLADAAVNDTTISVGSMGNVVLSKVVPQNKNICQAVVYIWDTFHSDKPYVAFTMNSTTADYYTDDFGKATTIALDKSVVGEINYIGDVDCLEFIPDESGHFSIISENAHNILVYNKFNEIIEKNSGYSYDFEKNNTYYIKVTGNLNEKYSFRLERAVTEVLDFSAKINDVTNLITIGGKMSAGVDEVASITVYNPNDQCEQVDFVPISEDGTFSYSYKTPNAISGTYQAIVNNINLSECGYTTFNKGSETEIINRKPMISEKVSLVQSTATVSIDGVQNSTAIAREKSVDANVNVTNNNTKEQHITVGLAFYDIDNYMCGYIGIGKNVDVGQTELFTPSTLLPSDKDVLKIKVLIYQGIGIYNNPNIMASYVTEISNGQIKKYGSIAAQQSIMTLMSAEIENSNPQEFRKMILDNINEQTRVGEMAPKTYTPRGISFNPRGQKIDVDLAYMSNDYYLEKYFAQNEREKFTMTVKNKRNIATRVICLLSTRYTIKDGESYSIGFDIIIENLAASATKTFTIDLPPHTHFSSIFPGEFGHQLDFMTWDIGTSIQDALFSYDRCTVNLFPINRSYFGNEFNNAYDITPVTETQAKVNTTFKGAVDQSGDVDYLRFKPTKTGTYTIESTGAANIYGQLYNSSYTSLKQDNLGGSSKNTFKMTYDLTAGQTYYIMVSHNNGKTQGAYTVNITSSSSSGATIQPLALDGYSDTVAAKGEYTLFSFKPTEAGDYSFFVSGYNGGKQTYSPYIKLYNEAALTTLLAHHDTTVVYKMNAGQTYYLKFSGYSMAYARGRISVKRAGTLEFNRKKDGNNFIYVNNPEFITRQDIVDDDPDNLDKGRLKIFEQKDVTGINTYYQTHITRFDNDDVYPGKKFFLDIDLYNPSATNTVTVNVGKSAYGYSDTGVPMDYLQSTHTYPFDIKPGGHELLLQRITGSSWYVEDAKMLFWIDFEITGGNVTVSSLAAYNQESMKLNTIKQNGTTTDKVAIIKSDGQIADYPISDGEVIYKGRATEPDVQGKYKGIAKGQSATIKANLDFYIDNNTPVNKELPIQFKDDFYKGINIPVRDKWMSHINPLNDELSLPYAMPGNLHKFTYESKGTDGKWKWNFDFEHREVIMDNENAAFGENIIDTHPVTLNGVKENTKVKGKYIQNARTQIKDLNPSVWNPDPYAISMGGWGTPYHYTVTITNGGGSKNIQFRTDKYLDFVVGYCPQWGTWTYMESPAQSAKNNYRWASIPIPANQTTTFEITVLCGIYNSGLNNWLLLTN